MKLASRSVLAALAMSLPAVMALACGESGADLDPDPDARPRPDAVDTDAATGPGPTPAADASLRDARSERAPETSTPTDIDASEIDAEIDAGSTVDATVTFDASGACPFVAEPPVAVAGSLATFDTKTIVFESDGLHWTAVSQGTGARQTIALPSGVTALRTSDIDVGPAGKTLVLFRPNGSSYASRVAFFDGASFGVPLTLPVEGRLARADGSDRIFVLDVAEHVHVRSAPGSTFVDTGAVPDSTSGNFQWTVDKSGTQLALGVDAASDAIVVRRRPWGGVWSAPKTIATVSSFPYYAPFALAAGADGSVHAVWWRGSCHDCVDEIVYARSSDGITWSTPELAFAKGSGEPISRLFLRARSYAGPQMMIETTAYASGRFGAFWLRRCGGAAKPWDPVTLPEFGSGAAPGFALSSGGKAAFRLTPAFGTAPHVIRMK